MPRPLLAPLLILASICSLAAGAPSPDNPLGIDWGPAPSPEDGPPLSRNASRDPSLLPAQIGGIVGAYATVVLICGFCLVLIGRRLRLRAQTSSKSLDVEMVKPAIVDQYTSSPLSGTSAHNFSWLGKSPSIGNSPSIGPSSPRRDTVVTFDQAVIDSDKERSEREMQRLYAAVMEQNSKSDATVIYDAKADEPTELVEEAEPISDLPISPALSSPRPHISRPMPPRLVNPNRSVSQVSSSASSKRRGVRGLNISSPKAARFEEDEEPLSPTLFESPPAPPAPPSQSTTPSQSNTPIQAHPLNSLPLNSLPSSPRPSNASIPNSPHSTIRSQFARSQNISARTLPLRSPGGASVHTKETVLDRTGMHGISSDDGATPHTGMLSAPLRTPYSPYMPRTPMTPVTPRLVTRRERRARERAEGRSVVTELAKSEGELWDSAY